MFQKFTCAALILALTLAACALAETPLGMVPGLNWEDGPEAALELLGPEATSSSYSDIQIIYATVAAPFGIEGEPLELSLLYIGSALQTGILYINDADAQAYIDATATLFGAPVMLGADEYWMMDAFNDYATKAACYWKVDDKRCFILDEATEQNEDPSVRTLAAINIQDLVDELLEGPNLGDAAPADITVEDMFFTRSEGTAAEDTSFTPAEEEEFMGFAKSDFAIVEDLDTHGGFFGDGSYTLILDCSGNREKALENIADWQKLPLSENLELIMYGGKRDGVIYAYDLAEDAKLPRVQNGYFCFIDRHSESTDIHSDSELFDRASFNFSLAVYDTDTDLMYYFEFDT